jgi:hypothetical protein
MKPEEQKTPVAEPKIESLQTRATKFQAEFKALCEKYQCQVIVVPQFVPTNHGSYEITLSQSIGELQSKQN